MDAPLDQRFVDRLFSVPRTRMLGIRGELSSGDIGVSSNSVVGVSGKGGRGMYSAVSVRLARLELLLGW